MKKLTTKRIQFSFTTVDHSFDVVYESAGINKSGVHRGFITYNAIVHRDGVRIGRWTTNKNPNVTQSKRLIKSSIEAYAENRS